MKLSALHQRTAGALVVLAMIGLGDRMAAAQTDEARLGPIKILGDEPSYLDLGAGAFNIQGHRGTDPTALGRLEFRYGRKLFFIGPAAGILANAQGGVYGYGGFYSDIAFDRFVITPLAALGGYHRGGSEDLGGTFQFRLSVNAAYEFVNGSRIGFQFAHLSNAGIHDRNPGENELLLTYAIPLDLGF